MIDTDRVSVQLRGKAIDVVGRRILVSRLAGSDQEVDITEPVNCDGVGRIRHFRRRTSEGWPPNPVPIDPACRALGLPVADVLRAQAFQNAACNWRCWYCFVPYDLLAAKPENSEWHSAATLIDRYLGVTDRPPVIDLTGGQPDLTPEWIPWVLEELRERQLDRAVYVWSDDNLSNDYFWRYLSDEQQELVATAANYGRVGCFKGFDPVSFSFNTKASPELFDRQFELFARHLATGVDIYAYATITTPDRKEIRGRMRRFVERLQELDPRLPLRTVPLEIQVFSPVLGRMRDEHRAALGHQQRAIDAWERELSDRFSAADRALNVADVGVGAHRYDPRRETSPR